MLKVEAKFDPVRSDKRFGGFAPATEAGVKAAHYT
jgi:hypothetical protein